MKNNLNVQHLDLTELWYIYLLKYERALLKIMIEMS